MQKNNVTFQLLLHFKNSWTEILKYIIISGVCFSKKIKTSGGDPKLIMTAVKYTCYTHAYFWLLCNCAGINSSLQEDFQFQNISSNSQFRVMFCQVYL